MRLLGNDSRPVWGNRKSSESPDKSASLFWPFWNFESRDPHGTSPTFIPNGVDFDGLFWTWLYLKPEAVSTGISAYSGDIHCFQRSPDLQKRAKKWSRCTESKISRPVIAMLSRLVFLNSPTNRWISPTAFLLICTLRRPDRLLIVKGLSDLSESPGRGAGEQNRNFQRQWLQGFHGPSSGFLQLSVIFLQLLSNHTIPYSAQLEDRIGFSEKLKG